MHRTRQFMTLAIMTAVETIRQPVCLLLTTTCIVLMAAVPMLIMHNFGEDGKLARDAGLALHFVFGLFIAGYAASSSVTREMKSGTASAVLCKPVSREIFFLAKFAGVATVLIIFSVSALATTLLSERISEKFVFSTQMSGYITDWQTGVMLIIAPFAALALAGFLNFRLNRPFESTAFMLTVLSVLLVLLFSAFFDRLGAFSPFDCRVQWRILPASVLVTMALLILAAVAVSLSTRLDTTPTLTICCCLFMLGLMSDYLFGRHADSSVIASAIYYIVPNWQHFWLSDALTGGATIPWSYVGHTTWYALTYLTGILCLGIASFRHAEIT